MRVNFGKIYGLKKIGLLSFMLGVSILQAELLGDENPCKLMNNDFTAGKYFLYVHYNKLNDDGGMGFGLLCQKNSYAIDYSFTGNQIHSARTHISNWFFPEVNFLKFINPSNLSMYFGVGGSIAGQIIRDLDTQDLTGRHGFKVAPIIGVMWGRERLGLRMQCNLDLHYYPRSIPNFLSQFVWAPYIAIAIGANFGKS